MAAAAPGRLRSVPSVGSENHFRVLEPRGTCHISDESCLVCEVLGGRETSRVARSRQAPASHVSNASIQLTRDWISQYH